MLEVKNLNYIHANELEPIAGSDDKFEYSLGEDVPLYESALLKSTCKELDMWDVDGFVTELSCMGERIYYSMDVNAVKDLLVKVKSTETHIIDDTLTIKYIFEDGQVYEQEFDDMESDILIKLRDAAIESAPHLFTLRDSNTLTCNILTYECEMWG